MAEIEDGPIGSKDVKKTQVASQSDRASASQDQLQPVRFLTLAADEDPCQHHPAEENMKIAGRAELQGGHGEDALAIARSCGV